NVALLPGMALPFALTRKLRALGTVALAFVVALAVLISLPVARGIPYHVKGHAFLVSPAPEPQAHPGLVEAGLVADFTGLCPDERYYHVNFWQCIHNRLGFNIKPQAPLWMLFTTRRGLFLWTPLTAVSIAGIVLLIRRLPARRPYLLGLS